MTESFEYPLSGQWGKTRRKTCLTEGEQKATTQCDNCKTFVVPRGITDTHYDSEGERHCPNCGSIFGRDYS